MKIKELLKEPSSWTKCTCARDSSGLIVSVTDAKASSFCLAGAVLRCYPELKNVQVMFDKLKEAGERRTRRHYMSVTTFNDDPETTHDDILAVIESEDV